MYGIWCEVSGGWTGRNEAWLKDDKRQIKLFDTFEAAEAEAAKWQKQLNGNPYRTASFRYTAMEYDGWR